MDLDSDSSNNSEQQQQQQEQQQLTAGAAGAASDTDREKLHLKTILFSLLARAGGLPVGAMAGGTGAAAATASAFTAAASGSPLPLTAPHTIPPTDTGTRAELLFPFSAPHTSPPPDTSTDSSTLREFIRTAGATDDAIVLDGQRFPLNSSFWEEGGLGSEGGEGGGGREEMRGVCAVILEALQSRGLAHEGERERERERERVWDICVQLNGCVCALWSWRRRRAGVLYIKVMKRKGGKRGLNQR
jgi:hypothetical protein